MNITISSLKRLSDFTLKVHFPQPLNDCLSARGFNLLQMVHVGFGPRPQMRTALRLLGLSILLKLFDPPNIKSRKDVDDGSGAHLVRIGKRFDMVLASNSHSLKHCQRSRTVPRSNTFSMGFGPKSTGMTTCWILIALARAFRT